MRGYCLCVYILGQLLSRSLGEAVNTLKPIQDGVLVTGGQDTQSHGTTWTVLVNLDAPSPEVGATS